MVKRRVALLSESDLLGESLEHILRGVGEIETLGPWPIDQTILPRISQNKLDLLVIAQDQESEERVNRLMVHILHTHPDLPIIQVTPDSSEMLIYTSKILHATSADLIDWIHRLPSILAFGEKT